MLRTTNVVCFLLVLGVSTPSIEAQRTGARKLTKQAQRLMSETQDNDDDDSDRDEGTEGWVWEYKIIDRQSKDVAFSGMFRVKGAAVFEFEANPTLKNSIANRITNKTSGDNRIGDVSYDRRAGENTFQFDSDDDHELSGKAVVRKDTHGRAGVWFGTYVDSNRKRWRIELRKIDGEKHRIGNSENERDDVEGKIWEYKVINRKTKEKVSSGKIRIKGTGVFEVPTESEPSVKKAIADRIRQREESLNRIGDVSFEPKSREYLFRFDADDDHELSGKAVVRKDTHEGMGVWFGTYTDSTRERWRIELRQIED